jgi:hypothetical protein
MKRIWPAVLFSVLVVSQGFSQAGQSSREATVSESAGKIHFSANSPRPLLQILEAFSQKFGWVVSYEDPQFTAPQDLVRGQGDNSLQLPSGHDFAVDVATNAPDEEKTLGAVIAAYNQSKNPGRFELRKLPSEGFSIAGTAAYDDKGKISAQQAPFDIPITLPSQARKLGETVNAILQEVSTRSHTQFTLAVAPNSLLENTNVTIGGNAVQARELLRQSLSAEKVKMYWRLIFDPTSKGYFLDIHTVHTK